MSRSDYNEDCDGWQLIRWRGAVASAIRGSRGQQALKELAAALDAMPNKELIAGELQADGGVCALGCLGRARSIDMGEIDPYDAEGVAAALSIAPAMAREITFINDEYGWRCTPAERWKSVREWVGLQLKQSENVER